MRRTQKRISCPAPLTSMGCLWCSSFSEVDEEESDTKEREKEMEKEKARGREKEREKHKHCGFGKSKVSLLCQVVIQGLNFSQIPSSHKTTKHFGKDEY